VFQVGCGGGVGGDIIMRRGSRGQAHRVSSRSSPATLAVSLVTLRCDEASNGPTADAAAAGAAEAEARWDEASRGAVAAAGVDVLRAWMT
jgi:hypothetical protein